MLRRIVSFALDQPLFTLLLTALFIACGVTAYLGVPIEAYPDVGDIQATVITLYPGRAAEEVEKQVTTPLEVALSGLPHGVRIFSHTQFGLSYVVVTFDDGVDDYFVRQQVNERLQSVDGLPAGIQPQLAPLSTAIGEIYRFRLRGDGQDPTELRTVLDWQVARRLKMCPGVADVVDLGGFIKQYQVEIDQQRLAAHGVTLQQVVAALGRGSANAAGGTIDKGEQQYVVRGVGLLRDADDLAHVVVDARKGAPIVVGDLADVRIGAVPRQGVVGQDDDDEAVTGIVLMRKGENPSRVLVDLKQRVADLNAGLLPRGVRIEPFYDREVLVHTTLHTVFENLAVGAALVAAVLLVFLGSWRASLIVAGLIPLALLATFIGLRLRGISANLLSLGAMDFGIIVDGAVIVVENVFRRLGERGAATRRERREAVLEATVQVGRPTFFSMLIIIIAYVPVFALQRHEGRIFAPMAYTIISALIGSLTFSLTLVPLLAWWLIGAHGHGDNVIARGAARAYRPGLAWALRRPRTVLAIAGGLLAIGAAIVPFLGSEFLPELNEGSVWVNINLPPSVAFAETQAICRKLRAAMRACPEVATVVSKAGRPEDGTDPKMINMCEFFVGVKPQREWPRGERREDMIARLDAALKPFPGIDYSFSQPIRDNVLESISQIDGQIVVKVFGPDIAVLQQRADAVLAAIRPIRGVASAEIDREGQVPQLTIAIDRERAARYGLNAADVEDVIETSLGGKAVTEIWEGDRRFDVAVRLPEAQRSDLGAIADLAIATPSGATIPLSGVARISTTPGKVNISHEDGTRLAAISVFIAGRDMGSLVAEMRATVARAAPLPPGYWMTWGGEFENQQRAMKRLSLIVPVSVFMIFVLLFHTFGSVVRAALILATIPLALIGGIVALAVTGIPLSVSAAIGFIALMGQAVLNGVVMVSRFDELAAGGSSTADAVSTGAAERLRTILMTSLLAMLGLLPMALSHGIGSEVQRPLAVVVIGGLITATVLSLFALPAMYLLFAARRAAGGGDA